MVDEKRIEALYGETHTCKKVMGTTVNLKELPEDVSAVYGDGETYYWQITFKEIKEIKLDKTAIKPYI